VGSALPFQEPFRSPGHKQIRASSPKPPHRCDLAGEHRRADLIRGVAKPIGRDTFGAYARRWVDGYGGRSGTRLYIQPAIDAMESHIGHLRLAEIRPTDLGGIPRVGERDQAGTVNEAASQGPRHLDGVALRELGQHDLPGRPAG
jgi:hypothetical protein